MLRSALNVAAIALVGCAFSIAIMMFGFFASPEAVRTSPPSLYNTLLLDQLKRQ